MKESTWPTSIQMYNVEYLICLKRTHHIVMTFNFNNIQRNMTLLLDFILVSY